MTTDVPAELGKGFDTELGLEYLGITPDGGRARLEIKDKLLQPWGIVHGGEVMKLVDTAAGIAAIKHAGGMCVTVSIDEMSFLHPVHVGDLVTVRASVNDVGTTSLEVGVRVEVEDVLSGERKHTSSAYLVFVALDEEGKPRAVPPLATENEVQERRRREARIRRRTRLEHRRAIEDHRREVSDTI